VKRIFHLTHQKDFSRVKKNGRAVHHKLVVLAFSQNNLDLSRFAVVASKKIGNAVVRNRVRRRIKACIQESWSSIEPGWDLIFYSRNAIVEADYQEIKNAIKHLLVEAGVL
jgi:ribonuclease P protein component